MFFFFGCDKQLSVKFCYMNSFICILRVLCQYNYWYVVNLVMRVILARNCVTGDGGVGCMRV